MIPFHYYFIIYFSLFSTPFINPSSTMPVKRNFSSFSLSLNQPQQLQLQSQIPLMGISNLDNNRKKLRRLPHVFSKVLELPFDSDADVIVKENHDCFEFVANVVDDDGEIGNVGVKAHVVEIHPGIMKVVIRRRDDDVPYVDKLLLDVWRFRLPGSARAELATAVIDRGQLVVTVPKIGWGQNNKKGGDCKDGGFNKGNMGNPVFVH